MSTIRFFQSLRGKLILTYTLVTVLALLALEVVILVGVGVISSLSQTDQRAYLDDVLSTLYPKASTYLQPGHEDFAGLQTWLETLQASGFASLPPQNLFDSPAARIVQEEPIVVISAEKKVLAQAPIANNNLVGRQYAPPDLANSAEVLQQALDGSSDTIRLTALTRNGNYWMALPIYQDGRGSAVLGSLILTVKPSPSVFLATLPIILGWVVGTGVLLLILVAPFGALFGLIMSRGLTRRLAALTVSVDAWSEGNFQSLPQDPSQDEIGYLGRRLRNMAEQLNRLLQTQQELALLEERNRLARDLHDTVKQLTFATLMEVRAARNLLSSETEKASQHLEEAEGLIKTSQQELGTIITQLRPAALEGQGLAEALQQALDHWSQQACIPASLQVRHERKLPLAIEQAFYRVAQEALANAARHSRATSLSVILSYEPAQVQLEVKDNGIGFDPQAARSKGLGLQSMQERMEGLGGRLVIESSAENGTSLTATAPGVNKDQNDQSN